MLFVEDISCSIAQFSKHSLIIEAYLPWGRRREEPASGSRTISGGVTVPLTPLRTMSLVSDRRGQDADVDINVGGSQPDRIALRFET